MKEQRILNKELVTIISTFKAKDYTRLRAFMNAPYFMEEFNIKQSVGQLIALLTYFESNSKDLNFSREVAFTQVFPKEKKDKINEDEVKKDARLDRVTTGFLNIVKAFVFWSRQEKNDFEECFTLAKFYFEKELYEEFLRYYQKSKDALLESNLKDSVHFYKEFALETLYNDYLTLHDTHGKNSLNLLEMIQTLNHFYAVHCLEWLVCVQNRHKSVKQEDILMSNSVILANLIDELSVNFNLKSDILEAYKRILALTNDPTFDRNKILELRDLLEKEDLKGIPTNKLLDMKAHVRNFLQHRYTHLNNNNLDGIIENIKDCFDLYKLHWNNGSENNALQRHGAIPPNVIQNITTAALKLHQHYSKENQPTEYSDWVKNFLEKFEKSENKIHDIDGEADEIINLCWANYYLSIRDCENAEKSALYINFKNPYRYSSVRIILIEIYYMTNSKIYIETLGNFRVWLAKQKKEGTMPEEKVEHIRKTLNDRIKVIKQQHRP